MATTTLDDIVLGEAWFDVTAAVPALVDAVAVYQNVSTSLVAVVFGGASEPTGKSGTVLSQLDSVAGTAAKVWARGLGGNAKLSVQVTV